MSDGLIASFAVLASLWPLQLWARATATRAWGEGTVAHWHTGAIAAAIAALQSITLIRELGTAGGLAVVLSGWMVTGWLLVLAMNQWPRKSLYLAGWLGWIGAAVCGGHAVKVFIDIFF